LKDEERAKQEIAEAAEVKRGLVMSLEFKLQGNIDDLEAWGHEYVRYE